MTITFLSKCYFQQQKLRVIVMAWTYQKWRKKHKIFLSQFNLVWMEWLLIWFFNLNWWCTICKYPFNHIIPDITCHFGLCKQIIKIKLTWYPSESDNSTLLRTIVNGKPSRYVRQYFTVKQNYLQKGAY